MLLERCLHRRALHSASAAVNEPHFGQTERRSGVDVVADDRHDVRRREGVEVELALDRNAQG